MLNPEKNRSGEVSSYTVIKGAMIEETYLETSPDQAAGADLARSRPPRQHQQLSRHALRHLPLFARR